jgi:toxin CptA
MHAAPSVSYPVGRSAFAGRLLAALILLGLAAATAWTLQAPPSAWRHGLAFGSLGICSAVAMLAWLHSPQGVLRWDGTEWQWLAGQGSAPGRIELALDLQSHLLLRWRGEDGAAPWFWLERKSDPSHWDALRRAVYSRATPVSPAGQPPAAEQ